jgi:photosystem II stability/assembly factor-like uncharacterized protein
MNRFRRTCTALSLLSLAAVASCAHSQTESASSDRPGARPGIAASHDDAATTRTLTEDDLRSLEWRSIGPANMGGRVAAIALAPSDSMTWLVGYATGGLWKTTNNGTTFTPIFDDQPTSSIGSLAICDAPEGWQGWDDEDEPVDRADRAEQGKSKIIWVGSGEGNGRNSSSWGAGVFRSTDGGGSFEYKGLADAHDMPALAVHPADPDICYIAALGHLWGPNETRGVYKTTDGGVTWDPVLRIDENTGACDVRIDPEHPNVVYAAMYARRRSIGSYQSGGPEGGIYKSTDAGASWTRLTKGLPGQTGRIGLTIYPGDTDILYAVVESDEGGRIVDAWHNISRAGGVFRSDDGGASWERVSEFAPRSFYFSRIAVDPEDADRVYLPGWTVGLSTDGGRTFIPAVSATPHVDFHAFMVDPKDTRRLLAGCDGGLYVSHDQGKTWEHHNHMAVGQFYNVAVDDSDPYRIAGGLQDNGSWIGPSQTRFFDKGEFMGRKGSMTNKQWQFFMGGDGFHVAFDPTDPDIVYGEWQGGNVMRVHLDTGLAFNLKPAPKEGQLRFRFNWNAPFFLSPHDPETLYLGGNRVFKLTARGDAWAAISPDLSGRDPDVTDAVGSDAETAGTVVSLAESPLSAGLLWAGTDDGRLHVTSNDGGNDGGSWSDVTPAEVGGYSISRIEPSRFDARTAYVAVDGHRSDHMAPILLRTTDLGATWTSIVGDLPTDAPPEVVREDPRNAEVLYLGTEHAVYVTIDGGAHWVKLNTKSLPTVPVDDLAIQAREMDLIAGTHGRSVWILDDIEPLSQLTPEVLRSAVHLFESGKPAKPRIFSEYGALWSDHMFIGQNPTPGAVIQYWVREFSYDDAKLVITNAAEETIVELTGPARPGINRVAWDLQPDAKNRIGNPHGLPEFVAAGAYTVKLTLGEETSETTIEVLAAPKTE